MRLPKYYCVFINTFSISRVRQARIYGFAVVFFCFLLITSAAGIARLAWLGGSCAASKIGFCRQYIENKNLLDKVSFLDKSLCTEKQRLNNLVRFEDRTRLVYGLNQISPDVRRAGVGGLPMYNAAAAAAPFLRRTFEMQDSLSLLLREIRLQLQTFEQMGRHVEILNSYWTQRPSLWPASGNVTSGFGKRLDPIYRCIVFHDGIDIACEIGTPVFAPANGVVKEVGPKQDYGLAIVLGHPLTELETIYGHLSNYIVAPNQHVKRGDLLGYSGNSGKSTGPHLHYEIRDHGQPVNPAPYILPTDQVVD